MVAVKKVGPEVGLLHLFLPTNHRYRAPFLLMPAPRPRLKFKPADCWCGSRHSWKFKKQSETLLTPFSKMKWNEMHLTPPIFNCIDTWSGSQITCLSRDSNQRPSIHNFASPTPWPPLPMPFNQASLKMLFPQLNHHEWATKGDNPLHKMHMDMKHHCGAMPLPDLGLLDHLSLLLIPAYILLRVK